MNRIISPHTLSSLLALVLLSGTGLALASEVAATQPIETRVEQLQSDSNPPAQSAEIIHLAWDRVGAVA